jgi:capsular polysaccharide transport system permease protein
MAFGWGLAGEALCRAMPVLEPIFHFLPWLVFLTSGVYFSFESVPLPMAMVDIYNPVLHLTEFQRYAFDPGYPIRFLSLSYPAVCAAAFLGVGLVMNRYFRYTKPA